MPLLKRKPVLMHPLPSLSAIAQPLQGTSTAASESDQHASTSALDAIGVPKDGKGDEEQLDKLIHALNDPSLNAPPPPKRSGHKANGATNGSVAMPPPPAPGYRVKDMDVFYMPETGEVFMDYESFATRRAFYDLQVFQCEVSGRSGLSYFDALENEAMEVKQLHSRFPKQLRKAVLQAVNFQVEGKLETLADRVFERFVNRFFDNEKVFVDVQGDKYLARIVGTFPPKNLHPPPGASPCHPYAVELSMTNEEVNSIDDPMKYFYRVRLIEEGDGEASGSQDGEENKGEKWEGSVMEIQADKISRDRINFSRAMLKRFIRDCVHREAAIFSPWIVKKKFGKRYGLPTEMTDDTRSSVAEIKKRELDKRKRERDERLGITHSELDETAAESEPATKKKKKSGPSAAKQAEREAAALAKLKEKEEREREKERLRKEKEEEEERKKKRAIKYPAEDLLVEYAPERDGPAGRIEVRPSPNKQVPFGEEFEKFLMAWSFLNVMGKPLGLSTFTVDDLEQSLYHSDPYTSPVPLLVEIHAALLNALVRDAAAGNDPVVPLAHTGQQMENDTDYWEGNKGATAESLRPAAEEMAKKWRDKELSARDNRRGWEAALVGCLWERATLDVLPKYLDNILHLTFEDKPAPTRPTWSTGPSSNTGGSGLVPSKPEKRYSSLHFVHKLNIIAFLIELVSQTGEIRDYMEEASSLLTEVRKDQIEARREHRRVHAELEALEPKEEKKEGDGDVSAAVSRAATPNGHTNGTTGNAEQDELDESMMGEGEDRSHMSSPVSDVGRARAGASRRRAMKERAAEREAEEAIRLAKVAKEREELKAKKVEQKQLATEKKRLQDEEAELDAQLKQLELDFRRYFYALRTRPIGTDRFGNRVWWMDGLGSAPLYRDGSSKIQWGTGRLYLQGPDELELELCRASAAETFPEITPAALDARRTKDEGEGRLAPGQWAVYDTPEQLDALYRYLNPRGVRELHLQRALKQWWPEIEGGCRARRLALGLDAVPEEDTGRRTRPRRTAEDDKEPGYLGWKNRRTPGKD